MNEVLAELSKYPIKTRLSLTGTLVVARDIAHAKLKERLESGQGLPDYVKNHPIYYAGPAKTPQVLSDCDNDIWFDKHEGLPVTRGASNRLMPYAECV